MILDHIWTRIQTAKGNTMDSTTVIKHGPHAGHVIKGNYKISTDKRGRTIGHKWWRRAGRWVRCNLAEAMAGGVP